MIIRDFNSESDLQSVLEIINHDRLPEQPQCSAAMLGDALAGRSSNDPHLWQQLEPVKTSVIDMGSGAAGVVCFAQSRVEACGELLWMHAREDANLLKACVDWALGELAVPTVRAFNLSSALSLGIEGLPVLHRSVSSQVLIDAEFVPDTIWTYLTKPACQEAELTGQTPSIIVEGHGPQWLLSFEEAGLQMGHVEIGIVGATGVICYLLVDKLARRRGIARELIRSAECVLVENGASSLVTCLDYGSYNALQDRSAARSLFLSMGFQEKDRPQSFLLTRGNGRSGQSWSPAYDSSRT